MSASTSWLQLPEPKPCEVVHCKTSTNAVYIGRGSAYGNPFPIGTGKTREDVIELFRTWLQTQPELLRFVRQTLPGKRLGCYCAPEECHGDVLSEVAAGMWDHLIPEEPIFVFGSNLAGRHGKAAAKSARDEYGAVRWDGKGLTGHAYALPTKDRQLTPLPMSMVMEELGTFCEFAKAMPHRQFRMTRVGTGLAGLDEVEIRDYLIQHAPGNVLLPGTWCAFQDPTVHRIIVAGSRDFSDYALLEQKLDTLLARLGFVEIVSGGAKGADTLGERYAIERGYGLRRMPAYWHAFDRPAGHIRNRRMSWYSTHLVAFWNGRSPGTKSMIEYAKGDGLKARVLQAA